MTVEGQLPLLDVDELGTTIPALRVRLLSIAGDIEDIAPIAAARIREVVELMYRRAPVRSTRGRQRGLTPAEVDEVRAYAVAHPDASEWDIGRLFGRNQGRISEALNGKRR